MSLHSRKVYTINQAYDKATRYCSLQDRCQQETLEKLLNWGLHKDEAAEVLAMLISEQYVNDERFSRAFVRGKFNQKGWGKLKIKNGLRAKQISEACIALGMEEIDETLYLAKLESLATKKLELESNLTPKKRLDRTARYLLSKGFESGLVWEVLNRLQS